MMRGVVLYGCPMPPQTPCRHGNNGICMQCLSEQSPPMFPSVSTQLAPPLYPCPTCNRHVVQGTLCPWCTKPEQANVTKLKDAVRLARGVLSDLHKVMGSESLKATIKILDEALK